MAALCRDTATNGFGQLNGGRLPVVNNFDQQMEIRPTKILGFSLLLAGLALCGVGLWLLVSPAQYRATARIKLEPIIMDGGNGQDTSYDPYFIQTEFELIQSQVVLGRVVNLLNLNVEWGKKYAGGAMLTTNESIAILKKHLNLAIERNTRLIEISFTSEDPNEAARIANAIDEAYDDYRLERRNQEMLNAIRVLTDEFEKEDRNIEAKQAELEQMRKQLNVPNPEPVDELLKTNFPSYFQAKQELQKMIELHKLLQAKITVEKIDLDIPRTATLQIIDAAQPPKSPASPNRFLGAVSLAIGFAASFGGWRLLKTSRHPSV
jgi:uncharacterized protein involved in exopolysaccharide biosynthesis